MKKSFLIFVFVLGSAVLVSFYEQLYMKKCIHHWENEFKTPRHELTAHEIVFFISNHMIFWH